MQSKTAQIAAQTRASANNRTSAKIIASKDLATRWFREIVEELQIDDEETWSNVSIGRMLGYSETTIRGYLAGEKHLGVHVVLRMPWSMRWRFMKRMSEHTSRGGFE